jgi:hypothetical protein
MLWFLSLIVSIMYIIWLTNLIRFACDRANRIAIATETTALAVSGLYKAMPPEVRERAEREIEQVKKQVVTSQQQQGGTLAPILKFTLTMTGIIVAIVLLLNLAHAGERSFWDKSGNFAGSTIQHGNSTSVYDKSGRFDGTIIRDSDGTASFYDKAGRFTGSSITTK